ncbi:MAG: alanine racemase [Actinomycetota bacterium]|nr:alanine racemase [Actinomycetota bacterium]
MDGRGSWRPTRAEVDLECIRHNVGLFVELVGATCRVMAVVKADGYGHGAVESARAALQAGASRLGVALVEEGEELRAAGLREPIHLLFEPPPEAAARVVELSLVPTVYTRPYAHALSRAAAAKGAKVDVHIKVDTGMHRVGASPREAAALAGEVASLRGLEVEGIYTHLANASLPGDTFTLRQWETFRQVLQEVEEAGLRIPLRHAAASGAAISVPESRLEMIRLGIAMYGLLPGAGFRGSLDLRPALSLKTEVGHVFRACEAEGVSYGLTYKCERDAWIAVLPIGYADGLSRDLSNRWEVFIAGRRYPQVGTVCMDLCMVDLGDDLYEPGEEATIIGGYGMEDIGVERMAEERGTINYEVVCGIGKRVPRIYLNRL